MKTDSGIKNLYGDIGFSGENGILDPKKYHLKGNFSKNTENMGLKRCFLFKTTLDVSKKIGSVKIVHWTQNTVRFVVEIWAREIFTKI